MDSNMTVMSLKDLRKFGLVTGTIFVLIFGLILPWIFTHDFPVWPWAVAGFFWIMALIYPSGLLPIYRGWMAIGNLLGWINVRIILGIVFYTVFLSTGLVMKILGRDSMKRKLQQEKISYRIISHKNDPERMEKPY